MPDPHPRLDDLELILEIQKANPEFPVPKSWQFKQSFNLSLIAVGASIVGILISLIALYLSSQQPSLPTKYLGLPLPVIFAMGLFSLEFFGLQWVARKSKFVDPPAELYILTAYNCRQEHVSNGSTFFSPVRAYSEILKEHPLTEYQVPVTYRTYSPLYAIVTPRGFKRRKKKVKMKTTLSKRFSRWYWYRSNTKNVIFKEDTVKIAQITQRSRDKGISVAIDFFGFDKYMFRNYPLPEDLPWFDTINGRIYLAKRVILKEDFSLNSIIFTNGEIWPPEDLIFGFLAWGGFGQ